MSSTRGDEDVIALLLPSPMVYAAVASRWQWWPLIQQNPLAASDPQTQTEQQRVSQSPLPSVNRVHFISSAAISIDH